MIENDALSEVLRGVRLTGAIFLRGELGEPWGFQAPAAGNASALLAPGTDCLVPFHLVTEGAATVRVDGCEPLRLEPGEIVVLPRGDAHVLQNGAPRELVDTSGLLPKILEGSVLTETGGGGGPITRFICGYVGCDRQAEKLFLANLPPVFKVGVRPHGSAGWIESALGHLVGESESSGPGSRALLAKLAEALFIETLRRHMAQLRREDTGWLAAARDPANRASALVDASRADACLDCGGAGEARRRFADGFRAPLRRSTRADAARVPRELAIVARSDAAPIE